MFKKETALRIAVATLIIVAFMDLFRGYMHTANIWYASENIAKMTQTADTMNLMNSFGISNLLTGCIYLLIILKAKELSPYVLVIIPATYLIGIISSNLTGVSAMQVSEWNGKYMMMIYLAVTAVIGTNYFISAARHTVNQQRKTLKEHR